LKYRRILSFLATDAVPLPLIPGYLAATGDGGDLAGCSSFSGITTMSMLWFRGGTKH
jgi:hypothetical protein